ncbi:hypothetical protein [Flavobacterium ginsengiterrae]|uniref:Lipoprotein n=1 Tax=Flavobacterium ginsengiterrae TaxID=871695 RepID=A0ABP7GNS6_9FLAO
MKSFNKVVIILVLIIVSCKKEKNKSFLNTEKKVQTNDSLMILNDKVLDVNYELLDNIFLGDSILETKNYFQNLTDTTGYTLLKKQNELYLKNYLDFINNNIPQIGSDRNIKLKFEKQLFKNKDEYRIVLYSFLNNKKVDSLEFYRNATHLEYEPSNYTNLSYLNLKNGKIWQIKYFSSPVDKSVGYIFYGRKKILESGKVETDSLCYLDESLDVEMEKNKLYY